MSYNKAESFTTGRSQDDATGGGLPILQLDSILIPVPATSLVSGGRQKPSGRRREFFGRSMHRDAQSALTCPFYFAGFHNNKP